MRKKSTPVVTVRLIGTKPEKVPLSALSELMAAIQTLSGPGLNLLSVRRQSAGYELYTTKEPGRIVANLKQCGQAMLQPEEYLESKMLASLDKISYLLKRLDVSMQVYSPDKSWKWELKPDQWDGIKNRFVIEDEAVVIGELMRVGGASSNRCTIRVPNQAALVYCNVSNAELSRKLGNHLYSNVELQGRGKFFIRDWKMITFEVNSFHVRKPQTWDQFYRDGRKAGAAAWDTVVDPEAFIEDMR